MKMNIEEYQRKAIKAKKERDIYIWNSINRMKTVVSPSEFEKYRQRIPNEKADRIIEGVLNRHRIFRGQLRFDECVSDAWVVYLYTVYRCALCEYDYVEQYFKFMIKIVIIWNWYIGNDVKEICQEHGLHPVYIDSEECYDV